jgi:hypothetical protein
MARRIFRESALRRHNERLERIELPRYATLPWARLWLACGLLLAVCGALLWAADVPVYAAGPGVVGGERAGAAEVVALLPAEIAPRLRAGQTAEVTLPGREEALAGRVVAVEPSPLSPAEARARYGPASEAALPGPVIVVRVALDAPGADVTLWRGAAAEVRVAAGARSGLALLTGGDLLSAAGEE